MTNRIQTLRSATAGARPAAASRKPGELYINWADAQLGVIDAAGSPVDLLRLRTYSATADYAPGDVVLHNGDIYEARNTLPAGVAPWDGQHWRQLSDIKLADTHSVARAYAPGDIIWDNSRSRYLIANKVIAAGPYTNADWDPLTDVLSRVVRSHSIKTGTVTITQAAGVAGDGTGHARSYAGQPIVFATPYADANYQVVVESDTTVPFRGAEGNFLVSNRAANGFTLSMTGGATSATVRWKTIHNTLTA